MTSASVLAQEQQFGFETFTNFDAWEISRHLLDLIKENGYDPIRIRITYKGELIFHYLMDKKPDSLWPIRKEKTVMASGHSSLYTFLEMEQQEVYKAWANDESYAVCGGGFPIIEQSEVKGAICVSGLEHTLDHQIIIDALQRHFEHKKSADGQ